MGQTSSSQYKVQERLMKMKGKSTPPPDFHLPPLQFHPTHGENIRMSEDGFTATRVNSFCHGIVFSNRPIMVGERIYLQITEVSKFWHGVIRIGISAHNPSSIRNLPKHACPDLTVKPGYWAKSLGEKLIVEGRVVHYYISRNGNIHYGLDGKDLGIFHYGIDTRQTMWAMVDLYGACTSLRMINFRSDLVSNYYNTLQSERFISWPEQPVQQQQQQYTLRREVQHRQTIRQQQHCQSNYSTLPAVRTIQQSTIHHERQPQQGHQADVRVPPLHDDSGVTIRRMTFHRNVGRNVRLDPTSTIATRCEDEFSQGYVFAANVVNVGEWMVVRIAGTEESFIGSLAFGLTNVNPASINVKNLPEDSDLLLDRPEYWIVVKDVANSPSTGMDLAFRINNDGSVELSRNRQKPAVIMHVDASRPLYAFWDLFGHTSKIALVGSTTAANPDVSSCSSIKSQVPVKSSRLQSPDSGIDLSIQQDPTQQQQLSECVICFENGKCSFLWLRLEPRTSFAQTTNSNLASKSHVKPNC